MDAIYVGVDVSKDRLDVHVRPDGEAFVVSRDGKGLAELVERLGKLSPALVAVEATGGFETIVAAAIAGAALPLAVVNPAQIRHFAQAVGKRAKTDPVDAGVIAHFAEAVRPTPRTLPDEAARLLAELVGRRRQIIDMVVAERQREKRATNVRVRKSLARHLVVLEKELNEIDGDIDALVRGSPVWRAKEDLLASVPGIGKHHRSYPPCRAAGAGDSWPSGDRKSRWPGPLYPSVRPLARQKHDRWRSCHRSFGHFPGSPCRQSPQPDPKRVLPAPSSCW